MAQPNTCALEETDTDVMLDAAAQPERFNQASAVIMVSITLSSKHALTSSSFSSTKNQNQNQNQNQLYSPSVCKHTRNLLWFLRSSWYIHAYIYTYI